MSNEERYRKISQDMKILRVDIALLEEDLEDIGKRMRRIADTLDREEKDLARILAKIKEVTGNAQ